MNKFKAIFPGFNGWKILKEVWRAVKSLQKRETEAETSPAL